MTACLSCHFPGHIFQDSSTWLILSSFTKNSWPNCWRLCRAECYLHWKSERQENACDCVIDSDWGSFWGIEMILEWVCVYFAFFLLFTPVFCLTVQHVVPSSGSYTVKSSFLRFWTRFLQPCPQNTLCSLNILWCAHAQHVFVCVQVPESFPL